MTHFTHSGAIGDVIWALPTVRAMGGGSLTLIANNPTDVPDEAIPREHTLLSTADADFLVPLLDSLDYIHGVRVVDYDHYEPDPAEDLDSWRSSVLRHWNALPLTDRYAYMTQTVVDLSTPWVEVEPRVLPQPYVVHQITSRYRGGSQVGHGTLAHTPHRLLFVGTPEEYDLYAVPGAEYYPVDDLLDMAQLIAGAVCFVGNQSCGFALAQAMDTPRIQETFPRAPDCGRSLGPNGRSCILQGEYDAALRLFGVLRSDFGLMEEG